MGGGVGGGELARNVNHISGTSSENPARMVTATYTR